MDRYSHVIRVLPQHITPPALGLGPWKPRFNSLSSNASSANGGKYMFDSSYIPAHLSLECVAKKAEKWLIQPALHPSMTLEPFPRLVHLSQTAQAEKPSPFCI